MIDKITFCEIIENLRQQLYLDRKNGDAIAEMFQIKTECTYNDNLLVKSIMKLLQLNFPKSENGFCPIEFYCDTLEFGKGSEELITAEDLYDELTTKTL